MLGKAFPPLANGVSVAIELFGDMLVVGVVVGSRVEDKAAAESQGLGSRTGAEDGLESLAKIGGKNNARRKRPWHDVPPCIKKNSERVEGVIMAASGTFVQRLAANL